MVIYNQLQKQKKKITHKKEKDKSISPKKEKGESISPKKEKEEEKEMIKGREEIKENINNNIHIEVNESDSQEIYNNKKNIEENKPKEKRDKNAKFQEKENKDSNNNFEEEQKDYIIDNNIDDKVNKNDKQEDNIDNNIYDIEIIDNEDITNENGNNEYKIEEVKNTNQKDFKENKMNKKIKTIKKKKKKRLNLIKYESDKKPSDKIEIIDIENNPIYENKNNTQEQDKNISNININSNIGTVDKDENNKSKMSNTSSIKNRKSTITKKLKFVNSDKEDNEDTADKKNNINNTLNEIKKNKFNIKNKIDSYNNIVNLNLKLIDDNNLSKRSPIIKKRKKIKKKKYLISLDNKGNIKSSPDEKRIKITKKTTLIRSKSKDKPKERKRSQDTNDSNISDDNKIKDKEINFKIFKKEGENLSNDNEDDNYTKLKKELNNIRKINNIKEEIESNSKVKRNRKMRIAQGKNNAAFIFNNTEEIYLHEKQIKKVKKSGINKFEKEISKINRSVDNYKNRTYKGRQLNHDYNYDEIKYLVERSNSYKNTKKYKPFNDREKINCIKFENGITCILEINSQIFGFGNLIGDIVIINSHTYKELQVIREHDGTIISLHLLKDKSILSCSADRKMLKIRLNENGEKYNIEFIFTGYDNYIYKAIELMNTYKIVTCSWDDKLFVWERLNETNYKNILKFNEGDRVVDLLEINSNFFVSISENNELKIWNSNTFDNIGVIKNIKCIGSPNALCKINDFIICVLDYHEIQLIDIMEQKLVNKIPVDDGNLSCVIKLNDNSILVAEDFNNDKYCVFYIKQFYFDNNDLIPISHKKDKFYKTNKNNDKEIRALIQFSNGVIVQGIAGEYNGKDSGDLFFYY